MARAGLLRCIHVEAGKRVSNEGRLGIEHARQAKLDLYGNSNKTQGQRRTHTQSSSTRLIRGEEREKRFDKLGSTVYRI